MKKIIVVLIMMSVYSYSYAFGCKELLAGKWNIQFITSGLIVEEATGVFKDASFTYTVKVKVKGVPSSYSFSCLLGAVDQVTLIAYPVGMKTFIINKLDNNEIYLIDSTNEDYRLRLTR